MNRMDMQRIKAQIKLKRKSTNAICEFSCYYLVSEVAISARVLLSRTFTIKNGK